MKLLYEYKTLWSINDMTLQRTTVAVHEINTGQSQPIAQHPRPTGAKQKVKIKKQIKEMLNDGIIRESRSS